ncbi:MAG: triose-phosphate isomerase [Pseudomonadota bacterium]|nr:triose-phosphate isomerase [Pseudomonadota bacterium]
MKTIIANWKMNGSKKLVEEFKNNFRDYKPSNCDVVLCPPFVYLRDVIDCFSQSAIKIGAQNCSHQRNGALTGEISCEILTDIGCSHVIIAHSERRKLFHETSDEIVKKMRLAQEHEITPILCVGESAEHRTANLVEDVLKSQLEVLADLKNSSSESNNENLIVAYEPVWAIGTGVIPKLEQIKDAHAFIKSTLQVYFNDQFHKIRVLYGGSVNAANAKELFEIELVDGGLIGGASLDVKSFKDICKIASVESS